MMVDAALHAVNDSSSTTSAPTARSVPVAQTANINGDDRLSPANNSETINAKEGASPPRATGSVKPTKPVTLDYLPEPDDETESGPMANAPFVNKVWLIVNNPENHPYIRWVPGGKSIIIVDREGFEKQLLPYYFKHKRFTSFVRQLNMYGWHKVQDLSAGTMQSSEEHWQFANPNFIQGHPELLKDIVRNKGHRPANSTSAHAPATTNTTSHGGPNAASINGANPQLNVQTILSELEQIKSRQQAIGEDLGRMRKDNELLWTEYYQTRERYDKHSQVLGRILRFLATIYGSQSKILDMNDPMGEIMMQNAHPTMPHHALNLLPASQKPAFSSGIHDLQEIEQLQHQIEEASPGSVSNGNPTYSHRGSDSSLDSSATPSSHTAGSPPLVPPPRVHTGTRPSMDAQLTPRMNTPLPAPSMGGGAAARTLRNNYAPTPRASRAPSSPANAMALANPRQLSAVPYWGGANTPTNPLLNTTSASANNQLIRATPNRFASPFASRGSSVPPQLSRTPGTATGSGTLAPFESSSGDLDSNNYALTEVPGHISPVESPDTTEDAVRLAGPSPMEPSPMEPSPMEPSPMDQDDPANLFPELNDLSTPQMPPLTSQELEQISRDVASNDSSLQNIQDWLFKQNADNEEHFNVDDFLDDGGLTPPSTADAKGRKNSNALEEPEKKRVRAS